MISRTGIQLARGEELYSLASRQCKRVGPAALACCGLLDEFTNSQTHETAVSEAVKDPREPDPSPQENFSSRGAGASHTHPAAGVPQILVSHSEEETCHPTVDMLGGPATRGHFSRPVVIVHESPTDTTSGLPHRFRRTSSGCEGRDNTDSHRDENGAGRMTNGSSSELCSKTDESWPTLQNDVDKAIEWLRKEVLLLKEQDKTLIKQFLDLGNAISKLRCGEMRPRTSSFTSSSKPRLDNGMRPRTSSFHCSTAGGLSPVFSRTPRLYNGFSGSTSSLDEEFPLTPLTCDAIPPRVSPLLKEEEAVRYIPDSVVSPRPGKFLTRPHISWSFENGHDGLKSSDV